MFSVLFQGFVNHAEKGMTKRNRLVSGILVLALVIAAACLVRGIRAAAPGRVQVRLVNAAPDAQAVDLWVDGAQVFGHVQYTTVTTYTPLLAGPHTVQIMPSGSLVPVISVTLGLTSGTDMTIVSSAQEQSVVAAFLVDNNQLSNRDSVRIVHASPDTLAIDVAMTGTVTSKVAGSIPRWGMSAYIGGLGTGVTSFEVRPAGQTAPLLAFARTLDVDTINTVFIMGFSTPPRNQWSSLKAVHSVDHRFHSFYFPAIWKNSNEGWKKRDGSTMARNRLTLFAP